MALAACVCDPAHRAVTRFRNTRLKAERDCFIEPNYLRAINERNY